MKITLLTGSLLLMGASLCAQTISDKELQEIKGSFQKDAATKAIQNVLTNDKNIRDNALNRDVQGKIDHFFKYRVNVKGITDQQQSGRCWMFTSLNVLRPDVIKMYNLNDFRFSHNYLYFWDMFEKSNLFLENIISTAKKPMDDRAVTFYFQSPVGDGGVWNLFHNLGEKYGVVPQEVMPETAHSNNTSGMTSLLNERLRKGGYELREMAAAGKKAKELQKREELLAKKEKAFEDATRGHIYAVNYEVRRDNQNNSIHINCDDMLKELKKSLDAGKISFEEYVEKRNSLL